MVQQMVKVLLMSVNRIVDIGLHILYTFACLGRETKNGDAICERRQCYPRSFNTAITIFSADEIISRCRPQQEHSQQLGFLIA